MEKEYLEDDFMSENEIESLKQLEKEMYLAGDARSEVIRKMLDVLHMKEIIEDKYSPLHTK